MIADSASLAHFLHRTRSLLGMTRRESWLFRAFALWTLWVWGTRVWNVFGSDNSTGFIVVHVLLALVSVGFAVAALVVVSRIRRRRAIERDGVLASR